MLPENKTSIKCKSCKYYAGEFAFGRRSVAHCCKLYKELLDGGGCELYNKDISSMKICFTCKHYLGGGDWGLSCAADYYTLTGALNKACDKYEEKRDDS